MNNDVDTMEPIHYTVSSSYKEGVRKNDSPNMGTKTNN